MCENLDLFQERDREMALLGDKDSDKPAGSDLQEDDDY